MSCFYNDKKAFEMACKYADENKFEYDVSIRTRCDIYVESKKLPVFDNKVKEDILFCVRTAGNPRLWYLHENFNKTEWIGNIKYHDHLAFSDIAYGTRKAISIWCSVYDYVLAMNEKHNGNYSIWFENSITNCILDSGYPWEFFVYEYIYIEGRRWQGDHPISKKNEEYNCDYYILFEENTEYSILYPCNPWEFIGYEYIYIFKEEDGQGNSS
jgi:hypothetical protein